MKSPGRSILVVAALAATIGLLLHLSGRRSDTANRETTSLPGQRTAPAQPPPAAADSTAAIDPDTPVSDQAAPAAAASWHHAAREYSYGSRWSSLQIPEFMAFREWTTRFHAASSAAERKLLTPEGVALARARRAVMRRMIEHDPETALEATIPAIQRQGLPDEVDGELEQRVAGPGLLAVVPREPTAPGEHMADTSHAHGEDRFASIDGRTFRAHVYGRRTMQATEEGASLHGIALDGHLAVHASPLRLLEEEETPDGAIEPLDPLTGGPVAPPAAKTSASPRIAAFHGRFWSVLDAASLARLEAGLRALEAQAPPTQPEFAAGTIPKPTVEAAAPIAWTTGTKRLLVLRVDFSDKTGEPVDRYSGTRMTTSTVGNVMNNQVRPFYIAQSYNQTSFTTTVSSRVYRMPKTAASYASNYDLIGLYNDAIAKAAGDHKADNFDLVQIAFSYIGPEAISGSQFGFAGVAFRGGKQSFINGYYLYSVVAHELGHNYGLGHASLWKAYTDPLSDDGTLEEYGDTYDMMGGPGLSYDLTVHFNPWYKNELGWLPDSAVTTATGSGSYRVYRFDNQNAPRTHALALNVFRDGFRSYWISNRRSATGAMANNAYVQWGFYGMQNSLLLDLNTPGNGLGDAGLVMGAAIDDPDHGLYIKLSSHGGASPSEYLDLQVTVEPPKRNFVAHWGEQDAVVHTPGLTDVIAIAAGDEHGLALKSDRTLLTWGDRDPDGSNAYGELDIPYYALGEIASIAAGGDSSGVIHTDGSIVIWGVSEFGQNAIPPGLTNVKQLAIGGTHVIALRHDGTVAVWGTNDQGQISVPAGLPPVKAVSAGRDMSVILLEDGTVQHWGVNAAQKPAGLSGVVAVAAGWGHGVALKSDGTVVAWGDNSDGQASVPAGLNNVKQIGAGHRHSVALRNDGTVVAWGDNELRQATTPRGLPSVDSIAVAENHVIALIHGSNVPVFLTMPADSSLVSGSSASFFVAVDSPLTPVYRWQRLAAGTATWMDMTDTSEFSGTNTASFVVRTSYSMNGDKFRCVVGNGSGSEAISTPATLTVAPRPLSIAVAPRDREVFLGGSARFGVTPEGDGPFTFAWQTAAVGSENWTTLADGAGIEGASTAELSVTAASAALAHARYRCQVTDIASQVVLSLEASLRVVLPAPAVEFSSQATAPVLGGTVILRAPAGVAGASYLWRRDGTPLSGGTTLTLTDLKAADSGWYDVAVTDATGAVVTSKTYHLEVQPATYASRLRLDAGFHPVFEKSGARIVAMAQASDGSVFIAGDFAAVNASPASRVARLFADGTLDTRFRAPAISGGDIHALALQPDGRLLVAGDFSRVADVPGGRLVRLLQDGRVDPTFTVGSGFDRPVRALALQPDGRIIVGGEFTSYQLASRPGVVRLHGDGSLDTTFAVPAALVGTEIAVRALTLTPDGRILVGRRFPVYSPSPNTVMRLHDDGTQDAAFSFTGQCAGLVGMVALADGKILVAGDDRSNVMNPSPLFRLNADGSRDGSFQLDSSITGEPSAFCATAQGVFIACWRPDNADPAPTIARVDENGSLLAPFGMLSGFNDGIHAIVPLSGGGILAAGEFTVWNDRVLYGIARFNSAGDQDGSYAARVRLAGVVHGVVTLRSGDIVAAGDFTHVNGEPRENLARIDAHGTVVPNYPQTLGFDRPVDSLARLPGDGVLAAGAFSRFGDTAVPGVAEITNSGLLRSYSPLSELAAGQHVRVARLLQNGTRQLGGALAVTSPEYRSSALMRITSSGRIDSAADLPYLESGSVSAMVEQPDGMLLVAGAWPWVGSPANVQVARLHPDGTQDSTFECRTFGITDRTRLLALCNDGRVVAAGEQGLLQGFVRVLRGAAADPEFQPGAAVFDRFVQAVQPEGDASLLAGGAFSSCGGQPAPHLARLLRDGRVDTSFGVVGLRHETGATIRSLHYQADGSLIVAGSWLRFGQATGCGLVKLVGAASEPEIEQAPQPQAVTAGAELTLVAAGRGESPVSYQWKLDGVDIQGATGPTLRIANAQAFHAGTYTVRVSNQDGTITSSGALVSVAAPPASAARLLNLSTRALGQAGNNQLIPGFVLTGTGTKRMLVRAVGPGLYDTFKLEGFLTDPQISLLRQDTGAEVASNGDWGASANKGEIITTSVAVGAFPLLEDSADAVILVNLPAGAYTAPTVDGNGGSGLAMVELYDADFEPSACQLVNISNRGFVDVGDRIMIPGFVVSNEGSRTFLIRAVGPGLTATFGLAGVLPNPVLTVFRESDPILSNDDWDGIPGSNTTAAVGDQVGAFPLQRGSADAAFVVSLPPGAYTVQATGRDGATGIALVEIYLVP